MGTSSVATASGGTIPRPARGVRCRSSSTGAKGMERPFLDRRPSYPEEGEEGQDLGLEAT